MRNVQKEVAVTYTLGLEEPEVRLIYEALLLLDEADIRGLLEPPGLLPAPDRESLVGLCRELGQQLELPDTARLRLRDLLPTRPDLEASEEIDQRLWQVLAMFTRYPAMKIQDLIPLGPFEIRLAYFGVRVLTSARLLENITPNKTKNCEYRITDLGRRRLAEHPREAQASPPLLRSNRYTSGPLQGISATTNLRCGYCSKTLQAHQAKKAGWPARDMCEECDRLLKAMEQEPASVGTLLVEKKEDARPEPEPKGAEAWPSAPLAFLQWLWERGATLQVVDGRLNLVGPSALLTKGLRDEVQRRRKEIQPILAEWGADHSYYTEQEREPPIENSPVHTGNGESKKPKPWNPRNDYERGNDWRAKKERAAKRKN